MKHVRTIALNDLRIFFSQPSNLVSLIALPLAFTLVLGWAFSSGSSGPTRVRIDIVDQDTSEQSTYLLEQLRAANATLILCPMDNDADDYCRLGDEPLTLDRALTRAQEKRTEALLVIPNGYAAAVESGTTKAEIQFYAMGEPGQPHPVQQTMSAVLQKVNSAALTAGVTGALVDNLQEQADLPFLTDAFRDDFVSAVYVDASNQIATRPDSVRYVTNTSSDTAGNEEPEGENGFEQSVPGMGSMYVMFTVLAGMAVLFRERKQWTLQRLAALPLTKAQILGGKVLTYFTLGMIQYLIVFSVGILVGLNFGDRPLLLLPIMGAFTLCITALAFAIAPLVTGEEQANGIARLLALSLAPLGGAWWPLEIVPDFMRTIGHLSPIAWAMDGFRDIMWFNGGLLDILPEIAVLMLAAAILFIIGARNFRYT